MPVNDVNAPTATSQRSGDGPWARFLSYLRGDRYLVGAYPPEWQGQTGPVAAPATAAPVEADAPRPDPDLKAASAAR
jgi:hypothetical protein